MEVIERRIYLIRAQKVMLDSDLARLYQVETSNLNKAVKRNLNRFPRDFMFQLSQEEAQSLRFQIGMSKRGEGRGGRRYLPYAFTEHGVAMLSSVLNSERAKVCGRKLRPQVRAVGAGRHGPASEVNPRPIRSRSPVTFALSPAPYLEYNC